MVNGIRKRRGLVSVVAAFIMLIALATPSYASSNPWYDTYVSAESTIGSNTYTSNDSAVLAWGESYILESYLDMYSLTQDTGWLNKFTTHADTVIANADDIDNDGYLGWSTARYSKVELDNWTFATGASGDSTLPANWTRFQSTRSTAFRTTDNPAGDGDSYAVELVTNGTRWQAMYQQVNHYEPNTVYVLQWWGKTNGSAAQGRVYVRDATAGTVICNFPFTNTSWQLMTEECRTPAVAGHTLEIWLNHVDYHPTNGIAYFDEVKFSARLPYMVHDGMVGTAIAEFVRLVDQTPSLQSAYQTKATSYDSFLENNIVPRWEHSSYIGNTWQQISSSTGMYKQLAAYQTGQTYVPWNQALAYVHMLNVLHDVNGTTTYLDRVNKVGQYFKNALVTNGSAYTWNYANYTTTPEDSSHANLDIGAALSLYLSGHIFTGTDMDRFKNALMNVMWNGSTLSKYVDGSGRGDTSLNKYLQTWMELGQFDINVFGVVAAQYSGFTPTNGAHLNTLSRIMKWDRSKIVNQGFELTTSTDTTQPAQWNRLNSTSSTVYLDSSNAYEGKNGLTIKANGTTAQLMYQTWQNWQPATSYTLTVMGKTDGTAAGGKVYVKDETTGTILATLTFTDSTWTSYAMTFTSPSNTSDVVRTYMGNNDITVTNGTASFDNLKMKVSTDAW